MRVFEDREATRERVPLLVGVYGASGTGKTFSALRLAAGMQRVVGGDVHVHDTEARRALHYADRFKFRHVPFAPPFSPDDYVAALRHSATKGARIIVVDSMSHEHEGQGGVLEWHEAETDRLFEEGCERARRNNNREPYRDNYKMSAWLAPKAARRRLINAILQLGINAIFCFRAKEKIKPVKGKEPEHLGWMPIAGEDFIFEMTTTALLLPGAEGVPTWKPAHDGERSMVKRPLQFDDVLRRFEGQPLCEEIGEAMARWSDGDTGEAVRKFSDGITGAKTLEELAATWGLVNEAKKGGVISAADHRQLAEAKERRKTELSAPAT